MLSNKKEIELRKEGDETKRQRMEEACTWQKSAKKDNLGH